jgi:RNA polymerase sigma-70 factor (ECF subfamily)
MGNLLPNPATGHAVPSPDDGATHGKVTFDQELNRHAGTLKHYVRSLMPGFHGADDLAQEVLLKVWEKKNEFTPGTNFRAWIFQVARFYVMNQRRKLARSNVILLDDELLDQIDLQWMQADVPDSEAELEALQKCMSSLSPSDHQLLHIRYATKTPLETYAEQEGVRTGTLKARLFRLRDALRRCIELRLGTP